MDEKELLKEKFKVAVSSAVKVISEKFDIEIKFGNNISSKKDSLTLPEVVSLKKLQDFTNFRALADSEALKLKYTDNKTFNENEPKGTIAKALYSIAEKIRYEKIGSEKLKGVKNNIIQCYENKFKGRKIDEIKTEADVPITEAFELYLRSYFFNIKQNNTTKKVLSYWKDLFDKKLKKNLNELNGYVENQAEFNRIIAELIDNLEFEDSDCKEKEEENETTEDNPSSEGTNDENNSTDEEQNQQADDSLSAIDNDIDSLIENDSLDQNETDEVKGNPSAIKIRQKNFLKKKYKIFTNEYDEITEAKDLENRKEKKRSHEKRGRKKGF